MVVVDTNILAYLLIEGDRTAEAQALFARDSDWRTEHFALVEFTNLLATAARTRVLASDLASGLLSAAEQHLSGGLYFVAHEDALAMAVQYGVSAYDARFLATAKALGARLVTEDVKLRRAAPELTMPLAEGLR